MFAVGAYEKYGFHRPADEPGNQIGGAFFRVVQDHMGLLLGIVHPAQAGNEPQQSGGIGADAGDLLQRLPGRMADAMERAVYMKP